jgi:hypothetical protein
LVAVCFPLPIVAGAAPESANCATEIAAKGGESFAPEQCHYDQQDYDELPDTNATEAHGVSPCWMGNSRDDCE